MRHELPGLASLTDAFVLPVSSKWRAADGYWVIETPERPDFVFGNYLLLGAPPAEGEFSRWREVWDREFANAPAVPRVALQWEERWPTERWQAAGRHFSIQGVEIDESAVLHGGQEARYRRSLPNGVRVGQVLHQADWDAVTELMVAELADDEGFLRWRMRELFKRSESSGGWWAAWRGTALVAAAGLLVEGELSRFQEVLVRSAQRRGGIASALCAEMLCTLSTRSLCVSTVAIASPGSEAERLYERLGFRRVGTQWAALSPR